MKLLVEVIILGILYIGRLTQPKRIIVEYDRIGTDIQINCFEIGTVPDSNSYFWAINDSVHGLLQIPREFVACSQTSCDLNNLFILLAMREINASRFQCLYVTYQNNTVTFGQTTELTVLVVPSFYIEQNSSNRDILELDYTRLRIGAENTSIAWRYSSLTCQPSLFTVEGYTDRDALGSNAPTLVLNSTFTELSLPTSTLNQHSNNGSLYIRLLAYDESGSACARESAVKYYMLDINGTTVSMYASSEGEACLLIPIDRYSSRDYSSLEVVWPESKDGESLRSCYCPPYEGEHRLFSRCITTSSCNTSHTITVSDNSVCFSHLSQGQAPIPVHFTLMDFCLNYRCAIRSVVASFIVVGPSRPPAAPLTSLCFQSEDGSTSFLVNATDSKGEDTALTGTYTTPQCFNTSTESVIAILHSSQCLIQKEKSTSLSLGMWLAIAVGSFSVLVILTVLIPLILALCKTRDTKLLKRCTNDEIAAPPAPEYEDILELRKVKGQVSTTECSYDFTSCPAYATPTACT